MPLPLAANAADIPTDVCCTTEWELGERIRLLAFNAVCACIEPDCIAPKLRSWQTEGPRSLDVLGDSLTVSFLGNLERGDGRTPLGNARPAGATRAQFRVELRENGWPIIREHAATQTVQLPDHQVVNAVAKHARGHASKMRRALKNAALHTIQAQRMFPTTSFPHVLHRGVSIGDLTTTGPSGPQIAYSLIVTVDYIEP